MEPDLKAIAETHYERFLDRCAQNYELRAVVFETFGDTVEQWRAWKGDAEEDKVYDRAFEIMYAWDADYFVAHPLHAIVDYALTQKMRSQSCLTL